MTPRLGTTAIALASRAEPSGEQLVHLIPTGTFQGRDGRGPYQLRDAAAVIRASREHAGRRLMPIDYDHQIDFAEANGKPAPAAGWITGLHARADGIWGVVDWTARAAEHLARREYRYLSPAFRHKPDGEVTCLLRAALTNNPNLDQLTALARMEEGMDDLADVRKALDLQEDADVAAIVTKIRELTTARNAATPDPAQYVHIGDFERVVTEVNKLNQGIALHAATDHVEAQIERGKLLPFLRQWGIALCQVNKPAFDTFVSQTHKGIQKLLAPSGAKSAPPAGRASSGLSDEEIAIASRMGLTEEEFAKHRARTTTED
jgi:phage I-like protein